MTIKETPQACPAKEHPPACTTPASAVDSDALRVARLSAKRTLAKRGIMYRALQVMTWFVMLDVRLLGRIRSGPFFALLVKK